MADLTDQQAAQTIKITGANSTGTETQFISSYNLQLQTSNIQNDSAISANLAITTTPVECKVGASNLVNRKLILIQPNATGYSYGFSAVSQPFLLTNGISVSFNIGQNISIWVVKSAGSSTVSIAELS